jgi:hypothetical protein
MGSGIPDMTEIEYHHVPALAYREDLESPIAGVAVGWLGGEAPSAGEVPAELRDALRHACRTRETDRGELGEHQCEICRAHEDRGEFVIEVCGAVYVLPRMVLHYIDEHGYRPPDRFLEDLRAWWDELQR